MIRTLVRSARTNYEGLVLTTIDVVDAPNSNKVRFSGAIQGSESDTTATFLSNVKQINDTDASGQRLFEADRVSVDEAKNIIQELDGGCKPLFCIHGFWVEPGGHLKDIAEKQKNFNEGRFMLVPVMWPNKGGIKYGRDRVKASPGAGEALRILKNEMDSFPRKSLLCHSMGNNVLRHAADAKFKFDNIFMASSDVRHDLFHTSYIRGGDEEERQDGLHICKMLSDPQKGKVHVMTNGADYALLGSSYNPRNWVTRLGLVGNAREKSWWGGWQDNESLTDDEIKGCVINKDCNSELSLKKKGYHGYHFNPFAIDYYREQAEKFDQ